MSVRTQAFVPFSALIASFKVVLSLLFPPSRFLFASLLLFPIHPLRPAIIKPELRSSNSTTDGKATHTDQPLTSLPKGEQLHVLCTTTSPSPFSLSKSGRVIPKRMWKWCILSGLEKASLETGKGFAAH